MSEPARGDERRPPDVPGGVVELRADPIAPEIIVEGEEPPDVAALLPGHTLWRHELPEGHGWDLTAWETWGKTLGAILQRRLGPEWSVRYLGPDGDVEDWPGLQVALRSRRPDWLRRLCPHLQAVAELELVEGNFCDEDQARVWPEDVSVWLEGYRMDSGQPRPAHVVRRQHDDLHHAMHDRYLCDEHRGQVIVRRLLHLDTGQIEPSWVAAKRLRRAERLVSSQRWWAALPTWLPRLSPRVAGAWNGRLP